MTARCLHCAAWQNHPVDADEYRRIAAAGATHWWYRGTRRLLATVLGPHLVHRVTVGGRRPLVLDAGGGTGATGSWMTATADVVVADLEPGALAVARAAHPAVRPVVADITRLPFADGSFDAVLCVTVLYHRLVADPAVVVADLARLVRPGGVMCLMEPGGQRLQRGHDAVTHGARRFGRDELRVLCEQAGLEVLRCTGAYTFLVPPALVLGWLERRRGAGAAPQSDVERSPSGLGGVLGMLASLERRWLRRRNLPTGLSALVVARRPDERR